MDLIIRVVFFSPLFENIHFNIFCGVRILKILAAVKENFNFLHPGPPWARFGDPGVPDHLETPQSGQKDSKMKIYVKIIYGKPFRFYWKKILLVNFWTLFTENWRFLDNFDKNLFLIKPVKIFNKNGPKNNSCSNFGPFS